MKNTKKHSTKNKKNFGMKKLLLITIILVFIQNLWAQNKFTQPYKTGAKFPKIENFSLNIDPVIEKDNEGKVVFIKGKIKSKYPANAKVDATAKALEYIGYFGKELGIKNANSEFKILSQETDELGMNHLKMSQMYKGIPVYGAELIVHGKEEWDMINGRNYPTIDLDINTKLTQINAIELVQQDLKKNTFLKPITSTELVLLKNKKPIVSLVIFHPNQDPTTAVLAYDISIKPNFVERWQYFVDAKTGQILEKYNHTCAVDGPATATARDLNNISRNIRTYQKGNTYFLIDTSKDMFPGGTLNAEDPQGVIWTIDANRSTAEDLSIKQVASSNNSWSNPTAVSAHSNAGIAYDYFKNTFNRKSLNGNGGTIISIININETDEKTGLSTGMDNAFWNGEFMGYGNGKSFFKPLAGGLDVAGHEMTHGVIENTANLVYQNQSGAINESMADVFGVLIDRENGDFVVGEDVVKTGPFLRSLSDPNKGEQPANMSQRYTGSEDNGGVHINSGIPNKAFHLFVTGLSGANENEQKAKAEQVYYRALTKYLTRSSKFIDLRAAIIQSCTDLASTVGSNAATIAANAFDAVGIGGGSTTTPTTKPVEDLPSNIGDEFILSYDPCDKAIYSSKEIVKTDADYRIVVSNVIIDHKPSVADDGSFAYYVAKATVSDEGGTLNRVNLVGTPKVEILSSEKVWRNAAISKDGLKLAAVTKETTGGDEQNIFIFDLKNNKSKANKLYNPTYSTSVRSAGTPLYADALEWEYNGEYLVYDAFNQLKSAGLSAGDVTNSVEYWDVGSLKAWDNATNSFGDGTINKLFTNLAKNESIGNPSFAKKSTSVIAFDRVVGNKYSVLTVDFESKGTDGSYKKAEIPNNTIGFPEFSAKDDKLIYNSLVSKTKKCTADSTNTTSILLNLDKVTNKGGKDEDFIVTSALAVWYTIGKRQLPTKSNQIITLPVITTQLQNQTNEITLPTNTDKNTLVSYRMVSGPATIQNNKIVPTGQPGRVKVLATAEGSSTLNALSNTIEFCINPTKPIISVSELSSTVLLQSSADSTNNWFKDGVLFASNTKGVEISNSNAYTVQVSRDGCKSEFSNAYKAGNATAQVIPATTITDKLQGNTSTLDLPAKTDKDVTILYSVVSGPATIVGNKVTLTGQAGKVKIKALAPASLKFTEASSNIEFCVNPSKPSITITPNPTEYIFKSSAPAGNNWYRDGVAINETGTQISVVSTRLFTVQVDIEGCKSEFSDAKAADKAIQILANEPLAALGIKVGPVPFNDQLIIDFGQNKNIENLTLLNSKGNIVWTLEKAKAIVNINTKNLPMAHYLLKFALNNKKYSLKVLKQ